MASHLFCYSILEVNFVEEQVQQLEEAFPEWFSRKFMISAVSLPSNYSIKFISEDYGHTPKSIFLIRINDKEEFDRMGEIADLVRLKLGRENVFILYENENEVKTNLP